MSSAFERETKSAKEKRESNETRINSERSRGKERIGSNSLSNKLAMKKKKKKRNETKRNARTWCSKTCAFSDASAKDAIIAEAKTPKSKLLVDEDDMCVCSSSDFCEDFF